MGVVEPQPEGRTEAQEFAAELKLGRKLFQLHRRNKLSFREFVDDRIRTHILRAAPLARRRAGELNRKYPEADLETLERLASRALVRRLTVYGGVSSVPGIIPFLPISIPGIVAATVLETGLQIQEQLAYVMTLLLLRGHRGDDRRLLEDALPYVFTRRKPNPRRAALRNLAGELGESVLEQAFPILGRRALVRINSRIAIRVIPLIGVAVGAILSLFQAITMTRQVRRGLAVPAARATLGLSRVLAQAEARHERDSGALWGRALTVADLRVPPDAPPTETRPKAARVTLDADA